MASRIILVRHGPSSHVPHAAFVNREGLERWRVNYDIAGIAPTAQAPLELLHLTATVSRVVASDLPRAVASAERLAAGRPVETSALLREIPLAIPRWPTPLPLWAWGTLIHARWFSRILFRMDVSSADNARASEAVSWLTDGIRENEPVVVVTHGVFRRLLAQRLVAQGWTGKVRCGGYDHWSAWTFMR